MLPSSQDDDWSNEDDDFAMALNGISSFFTIQQSLENDFYFVVYNKPRGASPRRDYA